MVRFCNSSVFNPCPKVPDNGFFASSSFLLAAPPVPRPHLPLRRCIQTLAPPTPTAEPNDGGFETEKALFPHHLMYNR